jgi:hypothetical protein
MPLFNEQHLRSLAKTHVYKSNDSVSESLRKSITASAGKSSFDIFLSHSYMDKELILGITNQLEMLGYVVYVDWKEDKQLIRDNVTKDTAQVIRERLAQSKSLFFATTDNAKDSKWMPWELGYMDGKKARAAILPITPTPTNGDAYAGQEYLGIYPYIATGPTQETQKECLWVHEAPKTYVLLDAWLKGSQPTKHQ